MLEDRQKSSWTRVECHWGQGNKDQKAVQKWDQMITLPVMFKLYILYILIHNFKTIWLKFRMQNVTFFYF